MQYNTNKDNEYIIAIKGNKDTYNYNTNQMCNRCKHYKTANCPGHEHDMNIADINKYCPSFADRNYTDEQTKQHYSLAEFVKNYEKM